MYVFFYYYYSSPIPIYIKNHDNKTFHCWIRTKSPFQQRKVVTPRNLTPAPHTMQSGPELFKQRANLRQPGV